MNRWILNVIHMKFITFSMCHFVDKFAIIKRCFRLLAYSAVCVFSINDKKNLWKKLTIKMELKSNREQKCSNVTQQTQNKGNWSNAILLFIEIVVLILIHFTSIIHKMRNIEIHMRSDFIYLFLFVLHTLPPVRSGPSHVHSIKCINIVHRQWLLWNTKKK